MPHCAPRATLHAAFITTIATTITTTTTTSTGPRCHQGVQRQRHPGHLRRVSEECEEGREARQEQEEEEQEQQEQELSEPAYTQSVSGAIPCDRHCLGSELAGAREWVPASHFLESVTETSARSQPLLVWR